MAKILIVDDDEEFARQIARELSIAGHSCLVELRGDKAVELVRKHRPDLLILDVMLTGMSGFQICRTIRKDTDLNRTPILIVSAMNNEEEVRHGLAQGADDYVAKPLHMGALLQRVDAILKANVGEVFVDKQTGVANAQATRRELQRRLTSVESFGLAYVEVYGLRQLSIPSGEEGRGKVLRHLSRALEQCGQELDEEIFHVGHMGGGHFMVTVPADEVRRYCERVQRAWQPHIPALYDSLNAEPKEGNELDLFFYVTIRERNESTTPMEMMEVVSRLRRKEGAMPASGIHIDRRHLQEERS